MIVNGQKNLEYDLKCAMYYYDNLNRFVMLVEVSIEIENFK